MEPVFEFPGEDEHFEFPLKCLFNHKLRVRCGLNVTKMDSEQNLATERSSKPTLLMLAFVAFSTFFIALSIRRIVFQGLLETPSFEVSHYDAGAGDFGLIVQFIAAMPTVVLAVAWLCFGTRGKPIAFVVAALVPLLLAVTARGLQRYAPGYTKKGFETLEALQSGGHTLTASDVRAKLGEPLMRRTRDDGVQHWMYSYMPSCGYGWDKKHVVTDASGRVLDIYSTSEP